MSPLQLFFNQEKMGNQCFKPEGADVGPDCICTSECLHPAPCSLQSSTPVLFVGANGGLRSQRLYTAGPSTRSPHETPTEQDPTRRGASALRPLAHTSFLAVLRAHVHAHMCSHKVPIAVVLSQLAPTTGHTRIHARAHPWSYTHAHTQSLEPVLLLIPDAACYPAEVTPTAGPPPPSTLKRSPCSSCLLELETAPEMEQSWHNNRTSSSHHHRSSSSHHHVGLDHARNNRISDCHSPHMRPHSPREDKITEDDPGCHAERYGPSRMHVTHDPLETSAEGGQVCDSV